ncbi:hypothetical protein [Streptomyces sp. L-9-10]|uniref:hypothetical protein n=1 Tax=Streptomyces sp. L-9-10 TaxID=1478131 RepID=UPI001F01DA0F|nr:hypothetical protein [Streptomyces sp. L-9-10]
MPGSSSLGDLAGNPVFDDLELVAHKAFAQDDLFHAACMKAADGIFRRISRYRAEPTEERKESALDFLFSGVPSS